MSAYATPDDYITWSAFLDLDTPDDLDALLERASADLDAYLAWPAPVDAGTRIDTTTLTAFQADCLTRACAAQAAYRLLIGEEDMTEGAPRVLSTGGPISFAPNAPDRVGPDVLVMLAGAGLLKRSGVAAPPPPPDYGCPLPA